MKLGSVVALCAVLVLALASVATGAAPNALKTFGEDSGSEVIVTGSKSATIVNGAGEYGGVYVGGNSLKGKALAKSAFEFRASGDTAGGAPRFSIPVNDGAFDPNADYAFIDVANCGSAWVSTANSACKVYFGSEVHANWAAFATAHPTYKIADATPFIIADQPGMYFVTGIDLH